MQRMIPFLNQFFHSRGVAHALGVLGACISVYGLFGLRGVTGLTCCALGGALLGVALARLL